VNDSKVAIEGLDVIGNFIVTIPVIHFCERSFKHLSRPVDMEIELQRVEVTGSDHDLNLPVLKGCVIVFLCQSDGLEKGQVGHVDILLDHQLVEVNKFHFNNLDRFSTS
jgi:hypothetical protein